jgi:hypothetical protein
MTRASAPNPSGGFQSLASLGLTEEVLLNAARSAYVALIDRTPHHPLFATGISAWSEAVRSLRDGLAPLGWQYDDKFNHARSINLKKQIAIVVATGNCNTGISGSIPATKSPKGLKTIKALEQNIALQGGQQLKLDLPGFESESEISDDNLTTWIYLYHCAENEIRSELSLPINIGKGRNINTWQQRIILRPLPLDFNTDIKPPDQPEIDITIKRRA